MESVSRFFVIFISISIFSCLNGEGSSTVENEFSKPTSRSQTSTLDTVNTTIATKPLPDPEPWESIRKQGKVYVDKTSTLKYLLNRGNKLFLFTRPNRFGKTSFVEMLKSFFRGEQSLFEGLQIHDRGNIVHDEKSGKLGAIFRAMKRYFFGVNKDWVKYPVIHLDLSNLTSIHNGTSTQKEAQFRAELNGMLKDIAEEYAVDRKRPDFGLPTLIRGLKQKFKLPVIILIDEYDAPIYKTFPDKGEEFPESVAKLLNDLFVQIKANTDNLRFVWVTGESNRILGLSALESGLTNDSFVDVSDDEELAAVTGFTIDEIKSNFKSHIEAFSNKYMNSVEQIQNEIIEAYDGYRFSINNEIKVFNPISVVGCLRNQLFTNYWCWTSPRNYVIRIMYKSGCNMDFFDNLEVPRKFLLAPRNMFRENIPVEVSMLLTGHLTIKTYNKETDICGLSYPNEEIQSDIAEGVGRYVPSENKEFEEVEWLKPDLRNALENRKISSMIKTLNRIGFPHYSILLKRVANYEKEAARRLFAILEAADVLLKENEFSPPFIHPGNITDMFTEITTQGLRVNYVIEVKCGRGKKVSVLQGFKQQIEYATKTEKKRIEFNKVLNDENQLYLLTLHFTETWGGQIDEWVLLPFEAEKLRFDKMEASSHTLLDKIRNMAGQKYGI